MNHRESNQKLTLTRTRLRSLIPNRVFAQTCSDAVADALIDVLFAFGVLRSESRGYAIAACENAAPGNDAVTAKRLVEAIESAMREHVALAVLGPVLVGRAAWSSSHGTGDDAQARAELAELDRTQAEKVRSFGPRLEVSARVLVGYVLDVRRSRLREKTQRVDAEQAVAASIERVKTEQEHAELVNQQAARVCRLLWICTYNHAPHELGVLSAEPTDWDRIAERDWAGYAQRWVAERIVPALAELRAACPTLELDFEHIVDCISTVHDVDKRRREEWMRQQMLQLAQGLDDPADVRRAAEALGIALKNEAFAFRHFHDYFEGLAFAIERHVRRSRAPVDRVAATPRGVDPAHMDVRLVDAKRAECSVDGRVLARIGENDLSKAHWSHFVSFFQPERTGTAQHHAGRERRRQETCAQDVRADEPSAEETQRLGFSRSKAPGQAHVRSNDDRKGVGAKTATRSQARQRAMKRLNTKLVKLLGLTREPFPAVRGAGHQSLFKSTFLVVGRE